MQSNENYKITYAYYKKWRTLSLNDTIMLKEGVGLNFIVSKIMKHMDMKKCEWSDLEILKMQLGFQVLLHNILMIGCILALAKFLGIFKDSAMLLVSYGLLKMNAGGIHFEKSFMCLLSTSVFIISGAAIARHIEIPFYVILLGYGICMTLLWILGPQGTANNPISISNYKRMKRNTMLIVSMYFLITVYKFVSEYKIPYILLVATVFETFSLLPGKIKSRNCFL